jgi:uncharacterized membrane protein
VDFTDRRVVLAGFVLVLLLAAALNLHELTSPSLWNDEAFSFFVAEGGVRNMFFWIVNDTHPPFYYLTLVPWLDMGHSVFVLRSMSALSGVVAAAFVFLAGRAFFGPRVGLVAMLLFAVAPQGVMWAHKARPYAFQAMLVAMAFWGFARIVMAEQARSVPIGGGILAALRTRRLSALGADDGWLAYIAGAGLAMMTQHPAGFFVLGCNVAMVATMLRDPSANRRLLLNWVLAQLLVSAIWLTWLPEFMHQFSTHLTPDQINRKHSLFLMTPGDLGATLIGVFGVGHLWRAQGVAFLVYAVAAIAAIIALLRRPGPGLAVLWAVATPVVVCVAGFWFVHPIFGYGLATFLWLLVPYCVLVARGIDAMPSPLLRWPLLGLLLVFNLWGVRNLYEETPPLINEVAAIIARESAPGDGIIFSQEAATRFAVAYYLLGQRDGMPGLDRTRDGDGLIRTPAQAAAQRRNWVVVPQDELPVLDLAALPERWRPGPRQQIGSLLVMRFDRID